MTHTVLVLTVVLLMNATQAFAHPGEVDACAGHTATEWVAYPPQADGTTTVPSEPGEYHFHFSPEQMNDQAIPSLREYRRLQQSLGHDPRDLGAFTVDGRTYDLMEYTRQGEAILHCQGDEDVLHTGIGRIQVSP